MDVLYNIGIPSYYVRMHDCFFIFKYLLTELHMNPDLKHSSKKMRPYHLALKTPAPNQATTHTLWGALLAALTKTIYLMSEIRVHVGATSEVVTEVWKHIWQYK
jgi:hypothetical protein